VFMRRDGNLLRGCTYTRRELALEAAGSRRQRFPLEARKPPNKPNYGVRSALGHPGDTEVAQRVLRGRTPHVED